MSLDEKLNRLEKLIDRALDECERVYAEENISGGNVRTHTEGLSHLCMSRWALSGVGERDDFTLPKGTFP